MITNSTRSGCIQFKAALLASFLIWSIVLLGCAGDGTGTDDGGSTNQAASTIQPTLTSIQSEVFSATCALSGCHLGGAAPLGLQLGSETESFNGLVDIPSQQRTDINLLRVERGDPELSYIVWKVEGRSEIVGIRMPAGLAPLTSDQVGAIRQWIQDGALP